MVRTEDFHRERGLNAFQRGREEVCAYELRDAIARATAVTVFHATLVNAVEVYDDEGVRYVFRRALRAWVTSMTKVDGEAEVVSLKERAVPLVNPVVGAVTVLFARAADAKGRHLDAFAASSCSDFLATGDRARSGDGGIFLHREHVVNEIIKMSAPGDKTSS